MHRAFKAYCRHTSKDAPKDLATATFSLAAAKAAFYLALFILDTRKRVDKLLHADLIRHCVLLQLVSDILRYSLFVSSYRINIVSPAPEMPVPIFILQMKDSVFIVSSVSVIYLSAIKASRLSIMFAKSWNSRVIR